jgi:hypothetical protein
MYKNGRSRVVTVVRHIEGDVEEFSEEFKKVRLAGCIMFDSKADTLQALALKES